MSKDYIEGDGRRKRWGYSTLKAARPLAGEPLCCPTCGAAPGPCSRKACDFPVAQRLQAIRKQRQLATA